MKKRILCLLLAVLSLRPAAPAQAWGFFGHKIITQVAVYQLPGSMQAFYYRHLPELVQLSVAPDERRATDPTEAPKHYIDLDHFAEDNPFAKIPKAYPDAEAKFTADTLKKYGTVPWTVMDTKAKLVEAFQQRDTVAIVKYSAELSHYVGDSFVPLHTTLNYDGQLTQQQGIHALWESQLPERFIKDYKLDGENAEVLKDPLAAIWTVLQNSYGFLTETFRRELKASKGFTPQTKYAFAHRYGKTQRRYSDQYADAYEKEVGGMVAFRLKGAPTMVSSFWLTAWQEAGKPDLNKLMAPAKQTKEEKEKLAGELKAWKANTLAQDQLLLAQVKEKKKADDGPDEIKAAEGMAAPPPPPAPVAPPTPAAVDSAAVGKPAGKIKVKTKGKGGTEKEKEKEK